MTSTTKTTIKTYFETGDKPTQSQFSDFIDSCAFLAETSAQTFASAIKAVTVSAYDNSTSLATTGFIANATPPFFESGLQPDFISSTVVRFSTGFASNGANNPVTFIRTTAAISVDLATNGLNGLDTGTIASGDQLYFYLVRNITTQDVGILASKSTSYGSVIYPSGFSQSVARKLKWGCVYGSAGIRSFIQSNGTTFFTESDESSAFQAQALTDTSGSFTSVDLSAWIPNNARIALLRVRTKYNSGIGSSYIRPGSGSSSAGQICGTVTAVGGDVRSIPVMVQTNSTGLVALKTDTGVQSAVYVYGYMDTEYA